MAKNDFFNIADLSKNMTQVLELIRIQAAAKDTKIVQPNTAILIETVKANLAIAQQLSVISGHLGRLVELCESTRKTSE